jgi:hypothetical protein
LRVARLAASEGRDHQDSGLHHPQHLLLGHELVQRVGHNAILRPETCQGFGVSAQKRLNLLRAQTPNLVFRSGLACLSRAQCGLTSCKGTTALTLNASDTPNARRFMIRMVPPQGASVQLPR